MCVCVTDECDSNIEENNGDIVFIVENEQQLLVAIAVNIVDENDQELPPVENDQELLLIENEDADIDITQESICEDTADNVLFGTDQPDIALQQNKQLVVQPFCPSLDSTAPIDHQTTKHHILTNTGYNTEIPENLVNTFNTY